jgi:hypothetical protein
MKSIFYSTLIMLLINGCSLLPGGSEEDAQQCIDASVYISEGSSDLLEVPEDLIPYSYDNALIIPDATGSTNQPPQPCLEVPPTL